MKAKGILLYVSYKEGLFFFILYHIILVFSSAMHYSVIPLINCAANIKIKKETTKSPRAHTRDALLRLRVGVFSIVYNTIMII